MDEVPQFPFFYLFDFGLSQNRKKRSGKNILSNLNDHLSKDKHRYMEYIVINFEKEKKKENRKTRMVISLNLFIVHISTTILSIE